jgi:hypothetical protein
MTREQRYVEIVTETGTRRVLTLKAGRDTGVWCLADDGSVRPAGLESDGAKVFLRFDGARLFVGTRQDELQPLQPPTQRTTGGLRIAYRVGTPPRERADDDDEKTQIRAPPVPPLRAPRAASPVIVDEGATRVAPAPLVPKKPDAPFFPRSVVEGKGAFSDDETRIGPPPDLLKKASMPMRPPPAAPVLRDARLEDTAPSRPKPKRGTSGLTPIRGAILAMMVVVVTVLTVGSSRKPIAIDAWRALTRTMATQTRTAAPAAPSAALDPISPASASSTSAPQASASAALLAPPASTPAPLSAGALDERAAVLAVESGAVERAARLYEGLASSRADRPAYREAARILRARNVTP